MQPKFIRSSEMLLQSLRKSLISCELVPGDRVSSEREIALKYDVSRMTARKCLQFLVNEGLLIKKRGSGYYLPESSNRSTDVANNEVFILKYENEKYNQMEPSEFWNGVKEACIKSGRNIRLFSVSAGGVNEELIQNLKQNASGVISDLNKMDTLKVFHAGIPIVQIYSASNSVPYDSVVQDDLNGLSEAVRHLFDRGHRRISYLNNLNILKKSGVSTYNSIRRKMGYEMACDELGIFDPSLIVEAHAKMDAFVLPTEMVYQVLLSGATALLTPVLINHLDMYAKMNLLVKKRKMIKPIKEMVLRKKFGFVNWGHPFYVTKKRDIPTYIYWDRRQMGIEGGRRLLARIKEPDAGSVIIKIPINIVKGSTSGFGTGSS